MTAFTDLVTVTHPSKPGAMSKVSRAAYRLIWAAEGWDCPEDASWDGTSVLDRVATLEAVTAVAPPHVHSYTELTNKPTIPVAVQARKVIVNTGALTANTVKTVGVTWPAAMPDITYAVTAMVEISTPQTVAVGLTASSRTVVGCSLAVRSTVAVNAQGLNVHVIGLA